MYYNKKTDEDVCYFFYGCPDRIRTYEMLGSEPNALPLGYWALVLVIGVEPILLMGNRF